MPGRRRRTRQVHGQREDPYAPEQRIPSASIVTLSSTALPGDDLHVQVDDALDALWLRRTRLALARKQTIQGHVGDERADEHTPGGIHILDLGNPPLARQPASAAWRRVPSSGDEPAGGGRKSATYRRSSPPRPRRLSRPEPLPLSCRARCRRRCATALPCVPVVATLTTTRRCALSLFVLRWARKTEAGLPCHSR